MSTLAPMPTAFATAPATIGPVLPPPEDDPEWPITIPMYQEMIRLGLFDDAPLVYLWNGRLVERMPPYPPHSESVRIGYDLLRDLIPPGYQIDRERPMALSRSPSAPQPDLAIIRGRFRDFAPKFFPASAAALLVEVTDSPLAKDRRNAATYAAEGVPIYVIVNLGERQIELHSDPVEDIYRTRTILAESDEFPVILDGREVGRVRVADLLP